MIRFTFGVGYNSKGAFKAWENGKYSKGYQTWRGMLERCYDKKSLIKFPTYADCGVCDEWLDYQNFAEWFYNHEYSDMGYQLDKDLLIPNNKLYSPNTCCFVPQELNKLLNCCAKRRGSLPQGVSWSSRDNVYYANTRMNGRTKYLGIFDCPQEAYEVYKEHKEAYVKEKALEWQDRIADNVFQALVNWKLS